MMKVRRTHYEMAFEALLKRRGVPYVAVEDFRPIARARTGLKAFDYIVYPSGTPAHLVDLKGRKSKWPAEGTDCRQGTWVTEMDLQGLGSWQETFGMEYLAAFVFAYWHAGPKGRIAGDESGPGDNEASLVFAGRRYSFWLVPYSDYLNSQRPRSKRWRTVTVSSADFRRMSRPIESAWPGAPC